MVTRYRSVATAPLVAALFGACDTPERSGGTFSERDIWPYYLPTVVLAREPFEDPRSLAEIDQELDWAIAAPDPEPVGLDADPLRIDIARALNIEFLLDAVERDIDIATLWQVPYVYVAAGDTGVFVVDAVDPRAPRLVGHYAPDPVMRAGSIQAVGDLLVVTESEGPRALLLDISDPVRPQPIAGGDFIIHDRDGTPREVYSGNLGPAGVYFARKDDGGGFFAYDIRDPRRPRLTDRRGRRL